MARNQRKDFEVWFYSVDDISGIPLWWAGTIATFISVADQAEPQATFFQMAMHVVSKRFPLFIRLQYVK